MKTKLIDLFIDVYDNIVKYIAKDYSYPNNEVSIKSIYTNDDEESGMGVSYYVTDTNMKRVHGEIAIPINQIVLETIEQEMKSEYYEW